MNPISESIIYALVRIQQRGTLMHQIIKRNVSFSGCSVYYFDDWSALLAKLSVTPDERLPALIALDISLIRADNLNSMSYLRRSKRLRVIPTLLLESSARSSSIPAFA